MTFRVGAYRYRVRIADGPIILPDGSKANGLADRERRQILIAGDIKAELRFRILAHEIRHCWEFHIPPSLSSEQEAEVYALISDQMVEDLDEQGGREALENLTVPRPYSDAAPTPPRSSEDGELAPLKLTPVATVEDFETPAPPRGARAQCGICEQMICGGAIVTDKHFKDGNVGGLICRRRMFCDNCHHVQTWFEGFQNGRPSGVVVDGPAYTKGEEVEEFLKEHGEVVGVLLR